MLLVALTLSLGCVLALPFTSWADASSTAQAKATAEGIDKSDKTGTNPLNLQRSFALYNEFDGLGDAYVDYTRLRYTEPLADGKMSVGVTVPLAYVHAAAVGSGADGANDGVVSHPGVSQFGLSDISCKLAYIPYATA